MSFNGPSLPGEEGVELLCLGGDCEDLEVADEDALEGLGARIQAGSAACARDLARLGQHAANGQLSDRRGSQPVSDLSSSVPRCAVRGPGARSPGPGLSDDAVAELTELLQGFSRPFVIDERQGRYKRRVGNKMARYSTANSPFGSYVGAPPGGGFAVNVFLRDGDTVYRTWHTSGRGTEQLSYAFALIDLLPYGRQEEWQDRSKRRA